MAVTKLTEARIRDLKLGSGIHRDTEVKGLMVICHKTTKSYAVQGDVRRNGRHVRTVRVKIDRVDRIGLRDARNRARVLMSQIQSGVDPTDGPDETGITLSGALDAHLEEKQRRPRTVEGYRYHLDHYLKNWRNKAVADISRQMVRDMFADLKRRHGEPTAASVMRTLRAVINTAMRITEADLLDKAFDETEIVRRLSTADIIVAHNAVFDRPFFDRRFPQLRDRPWGCSLSQLDWLKLGYDGRALGHLLLQTGLYFDGHRAANDVVALTALLGRQLPDGRTIFSHLLETCVAESVRIEAVGSPFEAKDALKRRGYRWDPNGRFWWRELQRPDLNSETTWLDEEVYFGRGRPRLRVITPRERFAEPG
ncbi:MAG: site-specific integrase [Pseudomonadota bacterium]|nr:site-specific integrase [Pseudomonadota bacterium]